MSGKSEYEPTVGTTTLAGQGEESAYLYVARLPDGPIHAFNQVGAAIWREATSSAADQWRQRVADAFDRDLNEVIDYIEDFVRCLCSLGLMEPRAEMRNTQSSEP